MGFLGVVGTVIIVAIILIIFLIVFILAGGLDYVSYYLGAYKQEEKLLRASPYGDNWKTPDGWVVNGYKYYFRPSTLSDLSGSHGLSRTLLTAKNSPPDNTLVEHLPAGFIVIGKKDIEAYTQKLNVNGGSYQTFSSHRICGPLGQATYNGREEDISVFITIYYIDPTFHILTKSFISDTSFSQDDFINARNEHRYIATMDIIGLRIENCPSISGR